ncbi:MAG TPA: hypothetical protein DCS43_01390 [Verrucomicrobia bacterium]|nr:hypothetical protein [Verrucomicrobiota bacterium]
MIREAKNRRMLWCAGLVLVAFGLFAYLFLWADDTFWSVLAISVAALCSAAIVVEPEGMRAALRLGSPRSPLTVLLLGAGSAAFLYGVFALGNLAARGLFPFGAAEIDAVYHQGGETPRWIVASLLLLIVGPGEELFWRGYVQRRLSVATGPTSGLILAVLAYTGVHLATGNFTLILAAAVCGAFWSLLYWRTGSLWINIISHALWAAAIFVWWPMQAG